MDKKKLVLIFASVILLLVVSASLVITVLLNQDNYSETSGQVNGLTRTMNPSQPIIATSTKTPTQMPVELDKINCTYPSQYWIYWAEELDKLGILIPINENQYSPKEMVDLITAITDGDVADLLWQLFAAHLNLQQGTDPVYILDALNESDRIFAEIVQGKEVTSTSGEIMSLKNNLEKFNIGAFGPGLCPGAENLLDPTATNTPILSATPKWSNTPTASITPSVTPTHRPTLRPYTLTPTKRPPPPPPPNTETPPPTDPPPPTPES